eukprot:CAMPEP_0170580616 /NCGR_PEP_ID=MMETSP0224-20130122/6603_1 /TAXON_ID=285029 /ORGANISM="Togula jolla, Strain CCCM 725" /LENGTH=30 /DNA_ID= /DNA_START= /DNA_END= /DNA_ORIENTATION=
MQKGASTSQAAPMSSMPLGMPPPTALYPPG